MRAIRERMQSDLTLAMKARDRSAVSALRGGLSAIANAEAVDGEASSAGPIGSTEVARRLLSEDDVARILQREHDDLQASVEEMRRLDRAEKAEELSRQVSVLARYLPRA